MTADPSPAAPQSSRVVTLALFLALTSGCGSEGGGSAKVTLHGETALQASSIVSVTLTVGPGTGSPSFTPIVVGLTDEDADAGLSWTGFVQGIPVGPARSFQVSAFDGAAPPHLLYTGSALADVAANTLTSVSLLLQQADPSYSAHLVIIDALTASTDAVAAGGSIQLGVTAHELDSGTAFGYDWTASCGYLANPASSTTVWNAPDAVPDGGTCQVNITVSDSEAGSVTAYLTVIVD